MAAREGSPGPLRYRLWCGGLYKDITEEEIRQRVEPFADVVKVMLRSSSKDTFCFIQFRSQKDMDVAREKLDQSSLLGDRVCAQPATADKKKDPSGPVCDSRGGSKGEVIGKGSGKDHGGDYDYGRRRTRTPPGRDDRRGGKGGDKPRYEDYSRGHHGSQGRHDRHRDSGQGAPRPDSREAARPAPQWEFRSRDPRDRAPRDRAPRDDRGREDYRRDDYRRDDYRREEPRREDFRREEQPRDDFRRDDFHREARREDPRWEEPRRRDDFRQEDYRQADYRRPEPVREERRERREDFREARHEGRREDYRHDAPRREDRERDRSHRDFREPPPDYHASRGERGERADRTAGRYDDKRRGEARPPSSREYQGRATRDPPREAPREPNPSREYESGSGGFRKSREVYESKIPLGRHKITVENLPEDMTWVEFKDLGKDFGNSITFARTFMVNGMNRGMLEYQDRQDADNAIRELDDRRVEGSSLRLRAYYTPEGRGS